MKCKTVRNDVECILMSKKGCTYKTGTCLEITEQCNGCSRSLKFPSGLYCKVNPNPSIKWKMGHCNLATHVSIKKNKSKIKINPLKASKRSKRG